MYDVGTAEQDRTINELLTGQNLDTTRLQNEALVMQNDYSRSLYPQTLESNSLNNKILDLALKQGLIDYEYYRKMKEQEYRLTEAKLNGY